MWKKFEEPVSTEIEEGRDYSKTELTAIADQLLRDDSRSELCRECGGYGEETGRVQREDQFQDEQPLVDVEGHQLSIEFPEVMCPGGHSWFKGEGRARGIGGDNPILFEEHFQSRKKREIYCTVGTPDPEIESGLYNRSHPQGRKINSPEQRARNGASYYR